MQEIHQTLHWNEPETNLHSVSITIKRNCLLTSTFSQIHKEQTNTNKNPSRAPSPPNTVPPTCGSPPTPTSHPLPPTPDNPQNTHVNQNTHIPAKRQPKTKTNTPKSPHKILPGCALHTNQTGAPLPGHPAQ